MILIVCVFFFLACLLFNIFFVILTQSKEGVFDELWFGTIVIGPGQLHPLTMMFALSGSLMISRTLHIPKL